MIKRPLLSISALKYLNQILLTVIFSAVLIAGTLNGYAADGSMLGDQSKSISGRVVDSNGSPLVGVSILEKGTLNGIVSNVDGNYTITVASANSVLVFSYIGFETQEITVGSLSSVNVTLAERLTGLDEVVVVGYGTQRKEAVTGSVASVKGDIVKEIASSNITQALQGRVAGVEMAQTSTKPGDPMQIRIRGARSLTASNDPLIVLDGVPFTGSISDISTNDIKSVDILKDASATAIYGSRGANGVILLTTDRGQKGQKSRVTYNGYYGIKNIFAKYPMMDGPEFVALRKASNRYSNATDEADNVNTDWQDMFLRTGNVTSQNVGLSGGTQQGNYNFGAEYYHDQAVIPTQQYNRIALRAAIDQEVGKYFKFGFSSNNNYNTNEGGQVGLYGILSMSPIANPYKDDGTLKRTVAMPLDVQYVYTKGIVENLKDQWLSLTRGYATYNSMYGEVKAPWIDGLKYHVNLGLDFVQSNSGNYTAEGIGSSTPDTPSTASISNSHSYHWMVENLLTYDHTFAQKHRINAVAMYSAEQRTYFSSGSSAKNIPSEDFQFYSLGQSLATDITTSAGTYTQTGLISYMGRVMYSYDDRYMLTATIRSDAASVLAKGHKWHTYPAVSAGWNIKNENFMKDVTWLGQLKLRAGFGQTSNQAVSAYSTLGLLGTRYYNFGPTTYATGYYVSQLPNPGLGWEYSKTWNYGVDFSVLKNRLSGTIEYYVTNTKDILLGLGLPPTSGVSSITSNIGETQNKGFELSLRGTILDNVNGWTWEAGINVYSNKNKLVALASGQTKDEGNAWFVGHNINAIYDYKKIGLWQQDDPYRSVLEPGSDKDIVGSIKVLYTGAYKDDGTPVRQIGPDDRQIIDVDPDFQGGFDTRVAYKGFDLTLVGTFVSGGTLVSTLYGGSSYLNMMTGRRGNLKVDYWTPDNTNAKYPNPAAKINGDNPNYASTLNYFDGSYLKVRTITLGYNFEHNAWMKNSGISRLRVYFQVQNPLVMFSDFNKESGLDPETNSYGNQNVATGGYQRRILTVGFNTPTTRNYLFGVNLSF
jgi:TonB-dependent starch-binding outer membrane protein SusC